MDVQQDVLAIGREFDGHAAATLAMRDRLQCPLGGAEDQECALCVAHLDGLIDGRLDRQAIGARISVTEQHDGPGKRLCLGPRFIAFESGRVGTHRLLHCFDHRQEVPALARIGGGSIDRKPRSQYRIAQQCANARVRSVRRMIYR